MLGMAAIIQHSNHLWIFTKFMLSHFVFYVMFCGVT